MGVQAGTCVERTRSFLGGAGRSFPGGADRSFPDGANRSSPDGADRSFHDGADRSFPDGFIQDVAIPPSSVRTRACDENPKKMTGSSCKS